MLLKIHSALKTFTIGTFSTICILVSCTKIDQVNYVEQEISIDSFLKVPENCSAELNVIIKDFRRQLLKNNFAYEFVEWHGLPQWDKVIRLRNSKNDFVTLIIPTIKNNEITTFIGASIRMDNKVFFELHRQSSINNTTLEYSYVDINLSRAKSYLALLNKLNDNNFSNIEIPNNLASAMQDDCTDCWYEYEMCIPTLTKDLNDTTLINNMEAPFCWREHCYQWPNCDPDNPGGPGPGDGGGGCTDCPEPPDCTDPFWYSFIPIDDPCDNETPPNPPIRDTILNPCLDILLLQNSPSFISYMQELKDSTNSNKEYGYLMFKDNAGVFGNTPHGLISGRENHLSLGDFSNNYMLDCIAHCHFNTNTDSTRGLSVFSPDDLWTMCETFNRGNVNNPTSFTLALVTKNGTQYLLKIENLTKFRSWAQKLTEGDFRLFQDLYESPLIGISALNSNELNEKKLLQYLKTNSGSGLKLFSGNSTFTEWKSKVLDSNNNVITIPCIEELRNY